MISPYRGVRQLFGEAEEKMPRVFLDLNNSEDLKKVKGQWRVAQGLVPGESNEGLTAQLAASPARMPDYDDSSWQICTNIRKSRSGGFTFAWYRITVTLPAELNGISVAGTRVFLETNIDNYGEIWIDGKQDRLTGMIQGNNAQQRVEASSHAVPGARHVIACLAANGPLGEPRGGVFLRYATRAFESRD